MSELFLKVHDHLPVFAIEYKDKNIIYTPGFYKIVERSPGNLLKQIVNNPSQIENAQLRYSINELLAASQNSVNTWEKRKNEPFTPECLTIHVGNECNLDCNYCYSKTAENKLEGFPNLTDIKLAFNYLVENRNDTSKPITVVFHGSGEPTYHWERLKETHTWLSEVAKQKGLTLFFYLATNGYLRKEQAIWIAENMDLSGISCDGPPEIQQKQRGKIILKYLSLEETCKIFLSKNAKYDFRVTTTPQTVSKQLDIIKYLLHSLYAERIRIEPVYLFKDSLKAGQASEFLDNFLEAQNYAWQNGASVEYSGVRINELHGTYCDVSRNTIRLTPDGFFRNCFCKFPDKIGFIPGKIENSPSAIVISNSIQQIKKTTFVIPKECESCINIFHCSRGCPDFCIFEEKAPGSASPFKCELNQLFVIDQIKKMVDKALQQNE